MGSISRETFDRIYVMTLVGRFPRGVFGHLRLQKVSFFAELDSNVRPYQVHFYHHGQYSHELGDTLEVLLSMNYLTASPLASRDGFGGNKYEVRLPAAYRRARDLVHRCAPSLLASVDRSVREYGMLPQDELLKKAYTYLEDHHFSPGDLVLDAAIPDEVEVAGLDDDECEDIEMALAPGFVQGARLLIEGLESMSLNLDGVPEFELRGTGS